MQKLQIGIKYSILMPSLVNIVPLLSESTFLEELLSCDQWEGKH